MLAENEHNLMLPSHHNGMSQQQLIEEIINQRDLLLRARAQAANNKVKYEKIKGVPELKLPARLNPDIQN